MFESLLILFGVITLSYLFYSRHKKNKLKNRLVIIPQLWKEILFDKVSFYQVLSDEEKFRFEQDCYKFLQSVKVIGVKGTTVSITDRLLVAASAIIPLFGFPEWNYPGLKEVILYPSAFDSNFQLNNPNEIITGMVGNGVMEGKMILSKPALHIGFQNSQDKHNVGIHEFVHLFDKLDGLIDGVPPNFQDKKYALPWLDFIKVQIQDINKNESDIRDYGATNHQEFFAVASEYFFERPHLLEKKHPELYKTLVQVFNQDPADVLPLKPKGKPVEPKRNAPCICGSGLKYKKCCLKK